MALKTFNPTSAGRRHLIQVDRSHLYKGKPVKSLVEGAHSAGGRSNTGRITSRRKGGGHKTAYRLIDFKRTKHDMPALVERLEYDPNRTGFIALIKYTDGTLSYILAPQRLAAGDTVISGQTSPKCRPNGLVTHRGLPSLATGARVLGLGTTQSFIVSKTPTSSIRSIATTSSTAAPLTNT